MSKSLDPRSFLKPLALLSAAAGVLILPSKSGVAGEGSACADGCCQSINAICGFNGYNYYNMYWTMSGCS